MKRFSKNDFTDSAICNYCGKWKPTDLTPQQLEEMDWKCDQCKAKELKPQEATPTQPVSVPQDHESKEISKYDNEYIFLVRLIKLLGKEIPAAIPEIKQLAETKPFHTVADVEYLTTQIWNLATQKYQIPREWLIKKLPEKKGSLKKADLKEYSNEETKGINDFIIQHPKVMEVVIDAAKRATDEKSFTDWLQKALTEEGMEEGIRKAVKWEELGWAWFNTVNRETTEPTSTDVIEQLPTLDKKKKMDELLDSLSAETDPQKKEQIKQHIERIKRAKLLRADLWPSQEQAQDMLSHTHNSLSYNNDQEPDTSVSGPRPDEVGKEAESLNINQIVQILNAKDTNKVVRIDTKNLSLDLSDGTEISFDDAAKKAMDMSKTATGEFTGAEFSGTDASPNPLTDIGPWSSPEDYGKKPQKSPFPNSNWLPADDENLDQQPASNVAASKNDSHGQCARSEATWRVKLFDGRGVQYFPSEELANKYYEVALKEKKDPSKPQPFTYNKEASLRKEALQQQDVVDFYLLSLLPPEYLNKEVSPDHYDALTIFKGIIESLRNEYIERGMDELVDEAETTAWTKAIPESDMPEEIKKYYTFHDSPFPGRNYSDDEDEDNPSYEYTCDNCGIGLDNDEAYFFRDQTYCSDCENKAIHEAIREDIAYCTTHHVFVTDADDLKDYLHGYKFDNWDNHHDNGVCQVVRFDAGKQIWKEVLENADKQLRLQFEERKKRREEKPKQLKFRPVEDDGTAPNQLGGDDDPIPGPTASLKQAGEGHYDNGEGWWEAPTNFNDYTSEDFYKIFKYAPWKTSYGGPAWAEIARTINEMQKTTQWDKLVVLIDHYNDLGHNTGKLLDKFPEWHQWFKKLLDAKAKKNSIRYLMPKASKPVQNLVTEYLRVHGKAWREEEDEQKEKPIEAGGWSVGEEVLVKGANSENQQYTPAVITSIVNPDHYGTPFKVRHGNVEEWVSADRLSTPQFAASSLNRPFSKKAVLPSKFWIAPDGKEFPMGGVHGHWIENNLKKLKQYGIDTKGKNLTQIWNEMTETGWARVSNEPAGTRFVIEVNDLSNLPPYLDNFIAKYYTQGEEITLGNGKGQYVKVNDPFPNIQKAVNRELMNSKQALLDKKAGSTITLHDELNKSSRVYKNPSSSIVDKLLYPESGEDTLVRGVVDYRTGDIFVWNAYDLPHEVAMQQLGIPINDKTYPDDTFILDEVEGYNWIVNNTPQIMKKQKIKQAAISGTITNKILQAIHNNGGTTYNLTNGDMVGTPNFSVSVYPERERIVDGVDFDILEGFIDDNEDLLKDPANSLGAWTTDGKIYLDVVVTIPDQERAIDLAKQNNQIAIWDLQNGREISTGGTGGGQMPKAFSKKNLIKIADIGEWGGYWIGPNDKVYEMGENDEHWDWAYEEGIARIGEDPIKKGWVRARINETELIFQVNDLKNIPSTVDTFIAQHNGEVIQIDDYQKQRAEVEYTDALEHGIQKAVNKALIQTIKTSKTAEESLLSQDAQNQIASKSSPAYVIAVNNFAEAFKRGHEKDRSLSYAISSVQNLEKIDPKKLVEFINEYVVI